MGQGTILGPDMSFRQREMISFWNVRLGMLLKTFVAENCKLPLPVPAASPSRLLPARRHLPAHDHRAQIHPAIRLVLANEREFLERDVAAARVLGPPPAGHLKRLPGLLLG